MPQEQLPAWICPCTPSLQHISDLPNTISRKYAYADDPVVMRAGGDWQAVQGVLSKDLATIDEYLQIWKLHFSPKKMVLAVFHLSNEKAKYELNVNHNNEILPGATML